MPTRTPIHEQDRLAGELVRAYRAGDAGALGRLVQANDRLVYTVVRRHLRRFPKPSDHPSFEDLMQAGRIGMIKAADRYDPERASWATYATWWIRQHVQRESETQTVIRVPHYLHQDGHTEESRRALNCSPQSSIPGAEGDEMTLEQRLEARGDHIAEADTLDEAETWQARVRVCLRRLPPRHAEVLRRRHGLDGPAETLEQVGLALGVSRERIRQVEIKAEAELRHQLRLAYGELIPEEPEQAPGPRLYARPEREPEVRPADVHQAEEDRRLQVQLARQERQLLAAERRLAKRNNGGTREEGAMAEGNGQVKRPSQGTCPNCGGVLGGLGGNRCYRCKPAKGAGRPAGQPATPQSKRDPRPALAAALAAIDQEKLVSADVELEAMAKVLKSFRKLSPAGRRWVLEHVERD